MSQTLDPVRKAPVETRLRVRYAETDRMGVVHHANYLLWFEIGRTEYCRAAGFSYADMEKHDDVLLMVAEARSRYLASLTYDDHVLIRTTLVRMNRRLIHFSYEVVNGLTGQIAATGETVHLPVTRDGRRTTLPVAQLEMLAGFHPGGGESS